MLFEQMRYDYLTTFVAPMDGMWESTAITVAAFWELRDNTQYIGYCCIDAANALLRFYLAHSYHQQAQAIFAWLVTPHHIERAIAGTNEPFYFALCLDLQPSITPHSYLFRDNQHVELPLNLANGVFREAKARELDDITRFYHTNTAGAGEWIAAFLDERIRGGELFVLYDRQNLVATGECISSERQTPYADLGMVVAQAYRGRGLGSYILTQMKRHCATMGWQPICACAADNLASKRAIEKAGFISEHRMVQIVFARGDGSQSGY